MGAKKECKLVQPLWRIVWRFLKKTNILKFKNKIKLKKKKKTNIELLYDPEIPILAYIQTKP